MVKTALKALLAVTICVTCSVVVLAADGVSVFVNDRPISAEAFIQDDSTYVPLRAVSEALGAKVEWDGSTRSVYIESSEETVVPNIIEQVSSSVVAVVGNYVGAGAASYSEYYSFGTGVIIKSGGVILTNAHVVRDMENLTVIFKNGESYSGIVQYRDDTSDLAVVKIDRLGLTPIVMGSYDDLRVGETVIAIGTPLSLTMRNTATKGIVSGKDVSVPGEHFAFLQSDAATNQGNSGGPLINLKGELVGINSMGVQNADGVSWAIPSDTVQYVLKQFETNGKVRYPDLGVTFEQSWEANIGLPTTKGLSVKSGANGGLAQGDVVTQINGILVHSFTELHEALKDTYTAGDISVTRIRGDAEEVVQVTPSLKN